MVAFNTMVYVGLTVSKVVPWPKQLHPDQTRAMLARIGVRPNGTGHNRSFDPTGAPEEPLALAIARTEIPQAFGLMGGILILYVAAGGVIVSFVDDLVVEVTELAVGAAMIFVSVFLSHRRINPRFLTWAWALTCTALVAAQIWDAYVLGNHLPIVYSLLIIVVAAPVTLAWTPALTAGLLMVVIVTVGGIVFVPGIEDLRISVLAVVCLIVGVMLLRLRMSTVESLTEERQRLNTAAATDPVTGTLSRRGLLALSEGMADNAERAGVEIFVIMVRVRDLHRIDRSYGSAYGDNVLQTVAAVLRSSSRPGDLVGRWSGSRFLVVGMGYPPDQETFPRLVCDGIHLSGVDTGKSAVAVEVGFCQALPRHTTFEQMIETAESALQPAVTP